MSFTRFIVVLGMVGWSLFQASASEARPQVIHGWIEEYDQHIEAKVSEQHSALLNLASTRMKQLCPKWEHLDQPARKKFWSALLWAISGQESDHQRTSVYLEGTLPIDEVTGYQIRSEGLLQLSYSDVPNYHYSEDDISWTQDRALAIQDYESGTVNGNPKRTLLDAYANLNLGLWIMDKNISAHSNENLEKTLARYWATMNSARSAFQRVMSGLKIKVSGCF